VNTTSPTKFSQKPTVERTRKHLQILLRKTRAFRKKKTTTRAESALATESPHLLPRLLLEVEAAHEAVHESTLSQRAHGARKKKKKRRRRRMKEMTPKGRMTKTKWKKKIRGRWA
jgi:hypothetical protein